MAGDKIEVSSLQGMLYLGHAQNLGALRYERVHKPGSYLIGLHSRNYQPVGADHHITYALQSRYEYGKVVDGRTLTLAVEDLISSVGHGVAYAYLDVAAIESALKLAWGADAYQSPLDNSDAVTKALRLKEVMGTKDNGPAFFPQRGDEIAHHLRPLRIEGRRRLVEN